MMARGHPCWPRTRAILCASLWCVAAVAEAAGRPVTLTSVDGVPLAGAFFEARNGPASGVVLVHMLGRTKDDWQDLGNRLQQAGLNALAIDLRGHGQSGGSAARLAAMGGDVRAAVEWLQTRPSVQSDRIGIVGVPSVRALAMLSPALDYRGVRIDAAMLRRYGARPAWLAASTEDPYALRTLRELGTDTSGSREQRLTTAVAHGTNMLTADTSLSPELVDWLARTLIF
jgi:alpha-beta hydrolase superfamily lysophospholipase